VSPQDLEDLVELAVHRNRSELENREGYQGPAFAFAAIVKAHPDLEHLQADEAAEVIAPILARRFPEHADEPWEALGDTDSFGNDREPFPDFLGAWEAIREPRRGDRVDRAMALADRHPLDFGPRYSAPHWSNFRRFVTVCRWLFYLTAGRPFFVPCGRFSEALRVDRATISRFRRKAVEAGFLEQTAPSVGRAKATEFTFNVARLAPSLV
jgi:hypothetical protein